MNESTERKFSLEEISSWLRWLEEETRISPNISSVIRIVRRDLDHKYDGLAAFLTSKPPSINRTIK